MEEVQRLEKMAEDVLTLEKMTDDNGWRLLCEMIPSARMSLELELANGDCQDLHCHPLGRNCWSNTGGGTGF